MMMMMILFLDFKVYIFVKIVRPVDTYFYSCMIRLTD